ncbi:hypothetical protein DFJ58DRAFT_662372, partial [Suillus subalutaceus]|uniref:uncharacterized protein n=1 Tax=Suillus subalutaceus TaxID=48586 RepID=UPI001B8631DB
VRTICISDTHNTDISALIPPGDILIHAGCLTHSGTSRELQVTFDWLVPLLHEHKIVIADNHDACLQTDEGHLWVHTWRERGIIYLEDRLTLSKCAVAHSKYLASHSLRSMAMAPSNTHVLVPLTVSAVGMSYQTLITHGPPYGHLNLTELSWQALLAHMWRQPLVLHVFGHIHGGRGIKNMLWNPAQSIWDDVMHMKGG